VRCCLNALLDHVPRRVPFPRHLRSGAVRWPRGFAGSLTHKGTVVLGALVSVKICRSIGIDLELEGSGGIARIASQIAPEGLPRAKSLADSTNIAFSAKEATFKAYFPLARRLLKFEDVTLTWTRRVSSTFRASADTPGHLEFNVAAREVRGWIVSAAYLKEDAPTPASAKQVLESLTMEARSFGKGRHHRA
jgi:4'-phosphopantetheinyl transferase EntD